MRDGADTFRMLLALREGRAVPPPPAPPQTMRITVPTVEAVEVIPEGSWENLSAVWLFGSTLGLRYRDIYDRDSERRVLVVKLMRWQGDDFLSAYCFERAVWRPFRVSRIRAVIELASGRVVEDVQGFLNTRPEGVLGSDRVLAFCMDALVILAFASRSDGGSGPEEREVMMGFIEEYCGTAEFDRRFVASVIERLRPDRAAFLNALQRVRAEDARTQGLVLRHVHALLGADGRFAESEARVALAVERALRL